LFDDPFRRIDPSREKTQVRTPAHLEVARDAARRSIVLLKNEDELLPLPRAGKKIALIGPFVQGQRELVGPWNVYGTDADAIDLLSGMRAVAADPDSIVAVDGSGIEKPVKGGIEAAVAAAQAADIVVLAVGESQKMSGEAQSRTDIVIPAPQMALAEAVAATGKPMVVLLRHGRALALHGAVKEAPAILATWFLGSMSGMATADILFGLASPSARLPCSFPYESGQEPLYYAHKNTGRPNPPGERQAYKAHYREAPNAALYPFGHGLTYGEIVYTAIDMGSGRLAAGGELTVTATLRNSGRYEATEVAQLYVQDITASITRPVRELKAFQRVTLKPGESRTVSFTLKREALLFLGQDMQETVEPGKFRLWVAPSAQAEGVSDMFTLA